VLRSPFVNNKKPESNSNLSSYKKDCSTFTARHPKTIDALMKLELPSGVEVEIKVLKQV
jgi:small subunit ribosomal protein S10